MDPDTDVCQTEQPQISYSVDFTAEQSSAMGSPILYSIGYWIRVTCTLKLKDTDTFIKTYYIKLWRSKIC